MEIEGKSMYIAIIIWSILFMAFIFFWVDTHKDTPEWIEAGKNISMLSTTGGEIGAFLHWKPILLAIGFIASLFIIYFFTYVIFYTIEKGKKNE